VVHADSRQEHQVQQVEETGEGSGGDSEGAG